jgi:hypothetical protein
MAIDLPENPLRTAREEEAAMALWSTYSHPSASEADWRRLPEAVRVHYRRQARMALSFDPRGWNPQGHDPYEQVV